MGGPTERHTTGIRGLGAFLVRGAHRAGRSQRSASCDAQMRSYCEDPRGLDDIFARYDNLSPNEKQQIIAKAKQLAMDGGENQLDYEAIVAALIDILIQQALLGI